MKYWEVNQLSNLCTLSYIYIAVIDNFFSLYRLTVDLYSLKIRHASCFCNTLLIDICPCSYFPFTILYISLYKFDKFETTISPTIFTPAPVSKI